MTRSSDILSNFPNRKGIFIGYVEHRTALLGVCKNMLNRCNSV